MILYDDHIESEMSHEGLARAIFVLDRSGIISLVLLHKNSLIILFPYKMT